MQHLVDLRKLLNGDNDEETIPVLNDRFEVRELVKTTSTSKLYSGFDLVTDCETIIKFRIGRAKEQFVDSYSYLDEDFVPNLLWEESLGSNYVLIYEKKGLDIETLFKTSNRHFSQITNGMIFHLTICALEKLHTKKVIHGNLKPSKILTNSNQDGQNIFITGLEFCEKASRSANKAKKPVPNKGKRPNENIFSSINIHNGQSIGYKDDLESLSYIIFNLFCDGKPFEKFPAEITDSTRKALIKFKSNMRTSPLLSGFPTEFNDYLKYIQKLKPDDLPDYDYLRTLTTKLCQKIYVKSDVVACLDWYKIPQNEQSSYRAKMLTYFFCNTPTQTKKSKPGKFEDSVFNYKKSSYTTRAHLQTLQPDAYFKKNSQNMPILETQEEQNATKYYLDGFQLDLDEEYSGTPSTPRLATKDKVFITKDSKVKEFRSAFTEEEKNKIQYAKSDNYIQEEAILSSRTISSSKSLETKSSPNEMTTTAHLGYANNHEVLANLNLNHDEKSPFTKDKFFNYTKSKSAAPNVQSHPSQKEILRYQVSIPGSKPEKIKLIQK